MNESVKRKSNIDDSSRKCIIIAYIVIDPSDDDDGGNDIVFLVRKHLRKLITEDDTMKRIIETMDLKGRR